MTKIPTDSIDDSNWLAADRPDFLDRHPGLPFVLLAVLPVVLQLPLWLLRRTTDPIWFVSGLVQTSHLLPSWPFLDPNVGFTSEALGHLAASDWVHGVIPWWNPYTGIGMPLAGELQPGAFFLPFTLLFLLPDGVLWQRIAMQIIAGFSTYALLRELGVTRLSSLVGGALFALNGTIAWTPGPAAVYCSQPFLPLLLWGIERSRKNDGGGVSILAIGTAIAWSLLAGFPEPAYISGLLALAWGIFRLISENNRLPMLRRTITGWALGILVPAPLLIAFVDYLRQSDSFGIHNLGEQSLSLSAFPIIAMPYVYGLPGMSFWSPTLSHIWASIGGYAGILLILFGAIGIANGSKHRGLKILLMVWVLLAWAKTFGLEPVLTWTNYLPLLKQTDFLRYAPPSWGLALVILASFGLDESRRKTPGLMIAYGTSVFLLAVSVVLAWPKHTWWHRPSSADPLLFILLASSLGWASLMLLLTAFAWMLLRGEKRRMALAWLLVVDAAVMFMAPEASNARRTQIDLKAIQFLRDHQGLSRSYTLGPIEPNYSAYFRLASINHNVLPVPKLWSDFVDRSLLPGLWKRFSGITFWAGNYGEGSGEQALSRNITNYQSIGVRYVVTAHGRSLAPELSVPLLASTSPPAAGGSSSVVVKRLSATLEDSCTASGHAIGPSVICAIAKIASKLRHEPATSHSTGVVKISPEDEATHSRGLELKGSQSAKFNLTVPTPPIPGFPITGVGVTIEPANGILDGELAVEVCDGTTCSSGKRALSEWNGGSIFRIPLNLPVEASVGRSLTFTLTRSNGLQPLLIRTAATTSEEQIVASNSTANPRLQMTFVYGSALQGAREVYSDSLLDIWELPNDAPYFQVIRGGPCKLTAHIREEVTADCSAPALLLRRELYMPGWKLQLNGNAAESVLQENLFQTASVPAGENNLKFDFSPPHVLIGWIAAAFGLAGLLWQIARIARARKCARPTITEQR